MRPWAVLPVKTFCGAKSRLSALSPARRAVLARDLFEHVMTVLRACDDIAGVLVLTNGDDVDSAARAHGALVLRDSPCGSGVLGRIIDTGLAYLSARGAHAALVIMSDLPQLHVRALSRLVADLRQHSVVIVPDRHDQGTNALAVAPPDRVVATCFGNSDSFCRHVRMLRDAGIDHVIHRSPEIAFDLDLPIDLELLPSGPGVATDGAEP